MGVCADAVGAVTVSANTPRTTAATLAAMRRAGRMALSLPAGGRGHWQRSLMDGGDAPVSRLLSLCKPIPCSYRFKYPFPAAPYPPQLGGRVAPYQLCLCGRRADRGGASVRRGVGRRGRGVDRRGRARGCARRVRARVLGVLPLPGLGREGIAFALLGGGFAVWTGLTVVWSVLAGPLVGLLQPRARVLRVRGCRARSRARRVSTRVGAWLLGGLVVVTCLWALAGKAVPALYEDYGRLARLRSPVGYWNALALVMVFGLPIALWAASSLRATRGSFAQGRSSGCMRSCRARAHVLARGRARGVRRARRLVRVDAASGSRAWPRS